MDQAARGCDRTLTCCWGHHKSVSVPWPGSGLCIIGKARGHGIVHVDLPYFGVLQDDMGRMTFTLWYAGSISDHTWNRRLDVLREKPWSVLRVFAQQAAQSRCALLQCGGNMHKTQISQVTSVMNHPNDLHSSHSSLLVCLSLARRKSYLCCLAA